MVSVVQCLSEVVDLIECFGLGKVVTGQRYMSQQLVPWRYHQFACKPVVTYAADAAVDTVVEQSGVIAVASVEGSVGFDL